jgi:hypothetical protein
MLRIVKQKVAVRQFSQKSKGAGRDRFLSEGFLFLLGAESEKMWATMFVGRE